MLIALNVHFSTLVAWMCSWCVLIINEFWHTPATPNGWMGEVYVAQQLRLAVAPMVLWSGKSRMIWHSQSLHHRITWLVAFSNSQIQLLNLGQTNTMLFKHTVPPFHMVCRIFLSHPMQCRSSQYYGIHLNSSTVVSSKLMEFAKLSTSLSVNFAVGFFNTTAFHLNSSTVVSSMWQRSQNLFSRILQLDACFSITTAFAGTVSPFHTACMIPLCDPSLHTPYASSILRRLLAQYRCIIWHTEKLQVLSNSINLTPCLTLTMSWML